jgi:hypothetical protein
MTHPTRTSAGRDTRKFSGRRISSTIIASIVLIFPIILTADAALRAGTASRERRNAEVIFPTDPKNCPNRLPNVHMRQVNREILDEFLSYDRHFYGIYQEHLAPKTLTSVSNAFMYSELPQGNFVFWQMARANVEMSAWSDVSGEVVQGEYKVDGVTWNFTPSSAHDMSTIQNTITLTKPRVHYVAFISNNVGVFAHFIADHLGYWALLKETMPVSTRFIFADFNNQNQERLEILDPQFAKRVDWIQCTSMRDCSQLVQVRGEGSTLTVIKNQIPTRHMTLLQTARDWIVHAYPPSKATMEEKTVIYYTRNSVNAFHSRAIDQAQEKIMLKMIQDNMSKHSRPEKLVVFDGTESFEDQVAIFRSATTVIGAHGGGFANLFWTLPAASCETRPKVLEFLISPETTDVQAGMFGKTYYKLFSTAPWLEYHHIFYVPPSNRETLFIDLGDFEDALEDMFASVSMEQ